MHTYPLALQEMMSRFRTHCDILTLLMLGVIVATMGCDPQQAKTVEGKEITFTDDNFSQEVLQSDMPVLVDFWATWCGPCEHMEPIVATLSNDFDGRAKVGKLDVEQSPMTPAQYEVNGIPAFLIFKDGKVAGRIVGTVSYRQLAELLESFIEEPANASKS